MEGSNHHRKQNSLNPNDFAQRDVFGYDQQQQFVDGQNNYGHLPSVSQSEQQFNDPPLYPTSHDIYPAHTGINPALLNTHSGNSPQGAASSVDIKHEHAQDYPPGTDSFYQPQVPTAEISYNWTEIFQASEPRPQWQRHSRAPSEYSEISSVGFPSAHNSPMPRNLEYHSEHPSPMLNAQRMFPEQPQSMQELLHGGGNDPFGLGLENFTITDHRDASPAASPAIGYTHSGPNSPFLGAQGHLLRPVPSMGNIGLAPSMPTTTHGSGAAQGLGINQPHGPGVVPEINFEFAPPQRQPTFPGKQAQQADEMTLGIPQKAGRRPRAKSDPWGAASGSLKQQSTSQPGSREHSPARGRPRGISTSLSPSVALQAVGTTMTRAPSPVQAPVSSNATSPKMPRRLSTNSVPNDRDYILELAHPNRPGAGDSKRVQKHPATFQCTLCPKRFTRAYNLRSHLRTHTNDRPFVCSVCKKAFARQHDRKRHEGLHSGEKKFQCRGNLKAGGQWGCGRKFARADALGRHFRSEAGRVCIRPLLEEETAEQRLQAQQQPLHTPGMGMDHLDLANMQPHAPVAAFPNAILEKFPALANIRWDIASPEGDFEEYDDNSALELSGNEYEEELSDNGGLGNSNRNSFDGYAGDYAQENWQTGLQQGLQQGNGYQ
ncbi:hypothetical protein BZA77DRAFT_25551 [Pyronema omphalodes]|nr:hypothetical protein BZA77DRAFT_25551 [Pyronema omphalodes]